MRKTNQDITSWSKTRTVVVGLVNALTTIPKKVRGKRDTEDTNQDVDANTPLTMNNTEPPGEQEYTPPSTTAPEQPPAEKYKEWVSDDVKEQLTDRDLGETGDGPFVNPSPGEGR